MSAFVDHLPVDVEVTGLVKGSVSALSNAFALHSGGGVPVADLLRILLLNGRITLCVLGLLWTVLRGTLGTVHACLVASNLAVGFALAASSLGEPRHALRVLRPAIRGVAGRLRLHDLQGVAVVEVVVDEVCVLQVTLLLRAALADPGVLAARPGHLREEAGRGQFSALYALQVAAGSTPGRLVGSHDRGLVEHACRLRLRLQIGSLPRNQLLLVLEHVQADRADRASHQRGCVDLAVGLGASTDAPARHTEGVGAVVADLERESAYALH